MTRTPPPRPQRPTPSRPSQTNDFQAGMIDSKPYSLISFPKDKPTLKPPAGHNKFYTDRLHGTLSLTLQVETALHVSTGIAVLGSDVDSRLPLIKTMVQGIDRKLSIQGSSLKGCIRSVYEAITNSTLAVVTSKYKDKIPPERLPCKKKNELCPASQVFGALDWQGLIEFNDAKCKTSEVSIGFMPSLYRPRPDQRKGYFDVRGKVAGRKFYYHAIRAVDKGQKSGIPVQQAAKSYTFTTEIHFKNLQPAELGTLLVVLGQDANYPIALKVGGGKPIGMGTMTVQVTGANVLQNAKDWRDRYSSYTPSISERLTEECLQEFMKKMIKSAHSHLIQQPQMQEIAQVLQYPTDREAPEGMY